LTVFIKKKIKATIKPNDELLRRKQAKNDEKSRLFLRENLEIAFVRIEHEDG
jgi:hypothetical protein